MRTTLLIATRFVAAGLMPLLLRLILLWLTLRLDAAQGATQFIQFPLVGELLALGNFNQFQNLVHLIVQFPQRIRDERGVCDGFVDGGVLGGTEISGLCPLALGRRHARGRRLRTLVAAVIAALVTPVVPTIIAPLVTIAGFALFTRRLGSGFRCRFGFMRFRCIVRILHVFRTGRMRGKFSGRIRVRLTKAAGGIHFFRFGMIVGFHGFGGFGCAFRRVRIFFGRFISRRARTAATTTTTATAAAAVVVGASRRRGRLQIGIFVWHKFK